MNFLVGLVITLLGSAVVVYTDWLVTNFGHMSWVEQHLGMFGGTRSVLKIIGVFAVFIGLLTMFSLQDIILGWIAGFLVPNSSVPI